MTIYAQMGLASTNFRPAAVGVSTRRTHISAGYRNLEGQIAMNCGGKEQSGKTLTVKQGRRCVIMICDQTYST